MSIDKSDRERYKEHLVDLFNDPALLEWDRVYLLSKKKKYFKNKKN